MATLRKGSNVVVGRPGMGILDGSRCQGFGGQVTPASSLGNWVGSTG